MIDLQDAAEDQALDDIVAELDDDVDFVAAAGFAHVLQHDDTRDTVAAIDTVELRRIVTEVIREELQGDLGERITRNVRKLVRREVQRALAAQDTDEGLLP